MYLETVDGQEIMRSISSNLLRIADSIEEELKLAYQPKRKQHIIATNEENFLTVLNNLLDSGCLYVDQFRDNNSNLIYILYEERFYIS